MEHLISKRTGEEHIGRVSTPRQSNIELLRILAMVFVVGLHCNFSTLGYPKPSAGVYPAGMVTRVVLEGLCLVAVNVFVLISGWFSIKASFKGAAGFIFQVLYFMLGVYLGGTVLGPYEFKLSAMADYVTLGSLPWFATYYLILYLISPILNAAIQVYDKRTVLTITLLLFLVETRLPLAFGNGYSVLSFITLYLTGRTLRLYYDRIKGIRGIYWLALYVGVSLLNCAIYWHCGDGWMDQRFASYSNPLVTVGAISLLLAFAKLRIGTNKIINFVAKSAFAVYLLHQEPMVGIPVFKKTVQWIYSVYSGTACIGGMLALIAATFIIAVLLDQPRKWLFAQACKYSQRSRFPQRESLLDSPQ